MQRCKEPNLIDLLCSFAPLFLGGKKVQIVTVRSIVGEARQDKVKGKRVASKSVRRKNTVLEFCLPSFARFCKDELAGNLIPFTHNITSGDLVMRSHLSFTFLALVLLLAIAQPAQAQSPGPNVNMVSGIGWPGGDPFLQRQNEPSLAVSSRNPLHLLAGANDYRTVDLAGLADQNEKIIADAWLGLFKSFDGGQTWQSTLLPGYQQDGTQAGLASPIRGMQAAADPIVRAGANGLLYYSGIAFNRGDKGSSKFFVARFIDNNNENADPIKYLGTTVIDNGTAGKFVDKPWLAVDIPRAGATTATIDGQTFPTGNVYVSWSILQGEAPNVHTKVYLSRSTDGGLTWGKENKLSETVGISQGTAIGIDPVTGNVYVTWRRLKMIDPLTGTIEQTDAVMVVKSPIEAKPLPSPQ